MKQKNYSNDKEKPEKKLKREKQMFNNIICRKSHISGKQYQLPTLPFEFTTKKRKVKNKNGTKTAAATTKIKKKEKKKQ